MCSLALQPRPPPVTQRRALGSLRRTEHTPCLHRKERDLLGKTNAFPLATPSEDGVAGWGGHAWDLGRGFFREKSRQLNLEGERDRTHEEGGEWGTGRAHFGLRGQPLHQLQRQEATGSGDSITLPAPRPGLAASPRGWPILNLAPGNFSLRPGVSCYCPVPALPFLA